MLRSIFLERPKILGLLHGAVSICTAKGRGWSRTGTQVRGSPTDEAIQRCGIRSEPALGRHQFQRSKLVMLEFEESGRALAHAAYWPAVDTLRADFCELNSLEHTPPQTKMGSRAAQHEAYSEAFHARFLHGAYFGALHPRFK